MLRRSRICLLRSCRFPALCGAVEGIESRRQLIGHKTQFWCSHPMDTPKHPGHSSAHLLGVGINPPHQTRPNVRPLRSFSVHETRALFLSQICASDCRERLPNACFSSGASISFNRTRTCCSPRSTMRESHSLRERPHPRTSRHTPSVRGRIELQRASYRRYAIAAAYCMVVQYVEPTVLLRSSGFACCDDAVNACW